MRRFVALAVLLLTAALLMAGSSRQEKEVRSCLLCATKNLVNGGGNWYGYYRFSNKQLVVKEGDVLEYEMMLSPSNPSAKGGIDVEFGDGGSALRDLGLKDDAGRRAHGDADLSAASGKWLVRRIPLSAAKGRTTSSWDLQFEGDEGGSYAQFISYVRVHHDDGSTTSIYEGGKPLTQVVSVDSYTHHPVMLSVTRPENAEQAKSVIEAAEKRVESLARVDWASQDAQVALEILKRAGKKHEADGIEGALNKLDELASKEDGPDADLQAAVSDLVKQSQAAIPYTRLYTGHLVGHGHIDPQWLWDWTEGTDVVRATFVQVLKFLKEYPDFTYTQSSSAMYKVIEEKYPSLFKQVQAAVKTGRWELAGGRVVEGDTNQVSSESHARHFLYAQRFFRERFGKIATVGWEPDTFGHTAQMPQILRNGGCDAYYFCRGGKDKSLFWWFAPDGSKVLAFDQAAAGAWYGGDNGPHRWKEMLDFQAATGSKDDIWVYGVGDHGGGPTRENIQDAKRWMKSPVLPKVQFSTIRGFFDSLLKKDLSKLPTVSEELNPVFDGCYTTHTEVKRLNHECEVALTSAEAAAAVASRFGYAYPRKHFRALWEEVLFNHHHDTMGGSGVAKSYDRTHQELARGLKEATAIGQEATAFLAARVKAKPGDTLEFNPTGHDRKLFDGQTTYTIPAFGYVVRRASIPEVDKDVQEAGGLVVFGSERFQVTFDKAKAAITGIYDSVSGEQFVAGDGSMGRLELDHERPGGMSAWSITGLGTKELPKLVGWHLAAPLTLVVQYEVPGAQPSLVKQTFSLRPGSDVIDVTVEADWHAIGTDKTEIPTLRLGFDLNSESPEAWYDVPFAAVKRPLDGRECSALNWADIGDADKGVSILADAVHGHQANGHTMWLTLIRSSYDPDPNPNPGNQSWHYAIYPHVGSWKVAETQGHAEAFESTTLKATVPAKTTGELPATWGLLNIGAKNLFATSLKVAEDDSDLVLRFYEDQGRACMATVGFNLPVSKAVWTNFIEDKVGVAKSAHDAVTCSVGAWQIRTLKVSVQPRKDTRKK